MAKIIGRNKYTFEERTIEINLMWDNAEVFAAAINETAPEWEYYYIAGDQYIPREER